MSPEAWLLPLLACPACRGPLSEEGGGLSCAACAVAYPAPGGIPDFLSGSPRPSR